MVVKMDCAAQVDAKSIFDIIHSDGSILFFPRLISLGLQRLDDNIYCFIQFIQDLIFTLRMVFRKFQFTLANISRVCDLSPNVIVQISGDMKYQISETVSIRIGLFPELLFRKHFWVVAHIRVSA